MENVTTIYILLSKLKIAFYTPLEIVAMRQIYKHLRLVLSFLWTTFDVYKFVYQ